MPRCSRRRRCRRRSSSSAGAHGAAPMAAATARSGDPAVIGSHDLSARTAGFAGGLDYRLTPNTVVGFALAGGGTNWSLAQRSRRRQERCLPGRRLRRDPFGPGLSRGRLRLHQSLDVDRPLRLCRRPPHRQLQRAELGARLESGYRFATMFGGITPYAAIQAQSFRTPTYSETDVNGGGFALGYNGRTATDTRSELGARFDRLLALNPNAVLALRARLAWAHDWVSDPDARTPCSRRFRARASSSTARRRRRTPRSHRPAPSFASPTASRSSASSTASSPAAPRPTPAPARCDTRGDANG